ncbi:MAG: hypothetical protein L6R41_002474 [Letrouitia leprolyta]|nr:MAG: hypothetical protein L6R41_002474 [Letrouitia leprolyta]
MAFTAVNSKHIDISSSVESTSSDKNTSRAEYRPSNSKRADERQPGGLFDDNRWSLLLEPTKLAAVGLWIRSRLPLPTAVPKQSPSTTTQLANVPQRRTYKPPVAAPHPPPSAELEVLVRDEAIAKASRHFQSKTIPKDCDLFRKTLKDFNIRYPFFDHMFVSAAIFTHHLQTTTVHGKYVIKRPNIEPRLLLLKRSKHDPDGYANRWELPGGIRTDRNESILNGLAREVFLQTRLTVSKIVRQIDKGHVFTSEFKVNPEIPGDENWYKPCIEVQCLETQDLSTDEDGSRSKAIFQHWYFIPVKIRNDFHKNWSWITKAGVQYMLDGKIPGEQFVNTMQGRRAVRAFEIRESDSKKPVSRPSSQGRKRVRNDSTDSG